MTTFIRGKDGRLSTGPAAATIDLPKARRETLDVIQGNVQFHKDPYAAPVAVVEPEPEPMCFCAYVGGECDVCSGE
jgi:hypothetical protein